MADELFDDPAPQASNDEATTRMFDGVALLALSGDLDKLRIQSEAAVLADLAAHQRNRLRAAAPQVGVTPEPIGDYLARLAGLAGVKLDSVLRSAGLGDAAEASTGWLGCSGASVPSASVRGNDGLARYLPASRASPRSP